MATPPINLAISTLLGDEASVSQMLSSPGGTLSLVQQEGAALSSSPSPPSDLWPIQCMGQADRLILAGVPAIQNAFPKALEQGRFLETGPGTANNFIQTKMLDLNEKIQHYLSLNRLAVDGQLPYATRPAKYAYDSVQFIRQIQKYLNEVTMLTAALNANLLVVRSLETQMLGLIQNNIISLTNLLNQICNWRLPSLPSMATLLGKGFHWNGFNFNSATGFIFNPNVLGSLLTPITSVANLPALFSFGECIPNTPNLAAFFGTAVTSATVGSVTATLALPAAPLSGTYGDPSQYSDPSYVSEMQTTTIPVFDPTELTAAANTSGLQLSLPPAASIISNYSLPASMYVANICSAVSALSSVVIQPDDPNYSSGEPSTSALANLRALLIEYVNLETIVASGYDQNLVAAWLIYLSLNRTGRGGQWLSNFQTEYAALIAPSAAYIQNTPVPWNNLLGGSGVSAAPVSVPLVAALQADSTNNLKWRLSYIEASLLGYPRSQMWDSAADDEFLASFTGADLDYDSLTIDSVPTTTVLLGSGTAAYPVSCTYPSSLSAVMESVVAMAAANIQNAPGYQSPRPQNRYTYDMFANATLVDRFSQFWRDFNGNLQLLLSGQPASVVARVCNYVEALDSAIDPLGSPADYTAIQTDTSSRSQTWTPGSVMPAIPSALPLAAAYSPPTISASGWSTGTFDASAFLSRPDVQAQSLPVQIAMLRTNQSFSTLMAAQSDVQSAISQAIATAQNMIQSSTVYGWEIDTSAPTLIPPSQEVPISFGTTVFDQADYVTGPGAIAIQTAGTYTIACDIEWDTTGAEGTRTATLLLNGAPLSSVSAGPAAGSPFSVQISVEAALNVGDTLGVTASHDILSPQSVLAGSSFIGILEPSSAAPPAPSNPEASAPTVSFPSDAAIPLLSAVSVQSDGGILPVSPTATTPGAIPFVDGIALTSAAAAGQIVTVGSSYGQIYSVADASFTTGGLLYVGTDGILTQDYADLVQNARWIVCVGKAVSADSFIYQPHLPTNFTLNF